MLRKLATLLFTGLLVAYGVGWGQNSSSTPTVFDIAIPQTLDSRPRIKVDPPYFMSDNRVGTIFSTDTSWSHLASIDSVNSYTEGQDYFWVIKIEGKSTADSLVYLKMDEYNTFSGRLLVTRRDTLNMTGGLGMPAGAAYADSNTFAMPLGLIFTTQTWATYTQGTNNWATYIYFSHTKLIPGSYAGAFPTFSFPDYLDSLTVAVSDTFQTTADTVYSTVVTGRYGYTSLYLDKIELTGTATVFGLGYQVKDNGGSTWYGDLLNEQLLFVVDDSIYMPNTAAAVQVPTIPADSIRFVVYAKTSLRAIISSIKALWRD